MNRALLLLIVLLSAACGSQSPFPPGTGAVVDIHLMNQAYCGGKLPPIDETTSWTPSEEVIASLEEALRQRLLEELDRESELSNVSTPTPDQYYRRYAGAMEQGRQIVLICGEPKWLYDERGQDWRTSTIPYRDGGSGSFSAHYDPTLDAVTYFQFGFEG